MKVQDEKRKRRGKWRGKGGSSTILTCLCSNFAPSFSLSDRCDTAEPVL